MHLYGRGSPRRGSRKRERWGVVALGVVAGKETQKKLKLIEHIKTHNKNLVIEIHPIHIRNPRNSPFHLFDGFLSAIWQWYEYVQQYVQRFVSVSDFVLTYTHFKTSLFALPDTLEHEFLKYMFCINGIIYTMLATLTTIATLIQRGGRNFWWCRPLAGTFVHCYFLRLRFRLILCYHYSYVLRLPMQRFCLARGVLDVTL